MDEQNWTVVYRGFDPITAHVVAGRLRHAGHQVWERFVGSPALLGGGNVGFAQVICVPEEEAAAALALLSDADPAPEPAPGSAPSSESP